MNVYYTLENWQTNPDRGHMHEEHKGCYTRLADSGCTTKYGVYASAGRDSQEAGIGGPWDAYWRFPRNFMKMRMSQKTESQGAKSRDQMGSALL